MTIFFIVTLVILALGLLVGISRGAGKSLIRLITLILAAVATFFVAIPIAKSIADIDISNYAGEVNGEEVTTVSEYLIALLKSDETVAEIIGNDPTLEKAVQQLPVMLLAIATFILSFLVLCLVSLIVYAIFKGPLLRIAGKDKYDKPSGGSRAGGALIGVLSAVLCIGMILVPALGLVNMLKDLPEDSKIEEKETYYDPVVENKVVNAFNTIGFGALGNMYMRRASMIKTDTGETIYLSEDIGTMVKIYNLLVEYDIVSASAADGEKGNTSLVDALSDSEFTEKLMALVLESKLLSSIMGTASYSGGEFLAKYLGLPADDSEGYEKMTGSVASNINDNSDSIEEYEAYQSYESGDYTDVSVEESPAPDIRADYAPSEKVTFKVPGMNNTYELTFKDGEKYISIIAAGETVPEKTDSVKSVTENVETLKNNLKEMLIKSVDTQNMTDSQKQQFVESVGSTVDNMIKAASAAIAGNGTFDGKAVTEFLNTEGNADAALTAGSFKYGGIKTGDFAAAFGNGINGLLNSDSENAAQTLASIISPVAQIASSLGSGEEDDTQYAYVAPSIGEIIGAMHGSESLNGLGLTMLEAMAESSVVSDVIPETLTNEIIKAYTDENGDVTQLVTAVASSANIVAALSSGDADTVEKLIKDLTNNLNDNTASQIQSLVTDDFMAKYINSQEDAANAKTIASSVVDVLSGAKGRASYRNEAEALVSLYDLVINSHSFTTDDLVMLLRYAEKSDIIADVISRCNDCRVGLSASRREAFRTAMSDAFKTTTVSRSVAAPIYNDVSEILGLGVTFTE